MNNEEKDTGTDWNRGMNFWMMYLVIGLYVLAILTVIYGAYLLINKFILFGI